MSKPAFAPGRREVWYTDAITGFYAVRLTNGVWPHPTVPAAATSAYRFTPLPIFVVEVFRILDASAVVNRLG